MKEQKSDTTNQRSESGSGFTRLAVEGFKSIRDQQSIVVRPLTILAGANSSGKSSIMQPLLLMKQTLEANYDPGALKLDGPNANFSAVDQLLFHESEKPFTNAFNVSLEIDSNKEVEISFMKQNKGLFISALAYRREKNVGQLTAESTPQEIIDKFLKAVAPNPEEKWDEFVNALEPRLELVAVQERCFLNPIISLKKQQSVLGFTESMGIDGYTKVINLFIQKINPSYQFAPWIQNVIHLPGLRGTPERLYRRTATGPTYPGTFENYFAGIIQEWIETKDLEKLDALVQDLMVLGLTTAISSKAINDTQVEILVGRSAKAIPGRRNDFVSLADVGLGVSQVLPVLVALYASRPEQLVYLEQPEIHLHPKAQIDLAIVLKRAVDRGVRMVVETHSSLLLRAVQTLIARDELKLDDVAMHWFTRSEATGVTTIKTAELHDDGSFGDWPSDFDEVNLKSESDYLDAVEAKLFSK